MVCARIKKICRRFLAYRCPDFIPIGLGHIFCRQRNSARFAEDFKKFTYGICIVLRSLAPPKLLPCLGRQIENEQAPLPY